MTHRAWIVVMALAAAAAGASAAAAAPEVLRVTPEGEKPLRAERYTGRDKTYRMPFPELGPRLYVRETMVNPNTGWAELGNGEDVTLFVVSVRLVEGPRDARELDAVKRRYADFARQLPDQFRERSGKDRFGPTYGFTLLNAEAITGYPVKLGYRPSPTVESAAAHRFFVSGGVLYEIAALVQRRGSAAKLEAGALAARAETLADGAVRTFEPLRINPPNAPEKK